MNQLQILKYVQDYAQKEKLTNFHLYTGFNTTNEHAAEITLENLSQVLVGGTFLRKKLLIVPLLPFIKFDNSKHYIGLISTYAVELSQNKAQNKDWMISSLKNNEELFNEFSEKNKEIYFYSKTFLKERFSEVSDIFKNVLSRKGSLIQKTPSIAYNIDLNELIDVIRIKNFTWIENNLRETMTAVQENVETYEYLGIQRLYFQKDPHSNLTVSFIGATNSELIELFMTSLINNFIDCENNPNFSSSKHDIQKIVKRTLLEQKLPEKEDKLKKIKL